MSPNDWVSYKVMEDDKEITKIEWIDKAVDQETAEVEVRQRGCSEANYIGKTGTWKSDESGDQY